MTRAVLILAAVTVAAVVAVAAALSAFAARYVSNPDGWDVARVDAYIRWALGDA